MERYRKDVWGSVKSGDVVLISHRDDIEETTVDFVEIKDSYVIVSHTVGERHYPRWKYEADYPVYVRERE